MLMNNQLTVDRVRDLLRCELVEVIRLTLHRTDTSMLHLSSLISFLGMDAFDNLTYRKEDPLQCFAIVVGLLVLVKAELVLLVIELLQV